MPTCIDCGLWYPTHKDENPKNFLDIAYHDFDCAYRMTDDFEGQFNGLIFEGNILYEETADGSLMPVSSYSSYPEPFMGEWTSVADLKSSEITQEMKPVVPISRSYSWDEFKTLYPLYSKTLEKTMKHIVDTKSVRDISEYQTNAQKRRDEADARMAKYHSAKKEDDWRSNTYNVNTWTPWAAIDRKKWPNLWRFTIKFHFLPNSHKDTKYVSDKAEPKKETSKDDKTVKPEDDMLAMYGSNYYGGEN